jgi:fumarate reductase subunit C
MVEIAAYAVGKPMTQKPRYSKYHPKWYRTRKPIFWWVYQWPHVRFILRELTSVFVALYALILLFQIRALAQGPEAYMAFVAWLKTPASIVLHLVVFVAVIFHTITWLNLAPKAIVLHAGKKRVPATVITLSNYIAWAVVSLVIAWILLTI